MSDPYAPPQPPQEGGGKIFGLPVLVVSGIAGAIAGALLFVLVFQIMGIVSNARQADSPIAAPAITEDWILGNWEVADGCGAWYRYQSFRREGAVIAHFASQASAENMAPGGWEITAFDPATLTWSGPGWTLTASGADLVVQHDETCTWTRAASGIVATP